MRGNNLLRMSCMVILPGRCGPPLRCKKREFISAAKKTFCTAFSTTCHPHFYLPGLFLAQETGTGSHFFYMSPFANQCLFYTFTEKCNTINRANLRSFIFRSSSPNVSSGHQTSPLGELMSPGTIEMLMCCRS